MFTLLLLLGRFGRVPESFTVIASRITEISSSAILSDRSGVALLSSRTATVTLRTAGGV